MYSVGPRLKTSRITKGSLFGERQESRVKKTDSVEIPKLNSLWSTMLKIFKDGAPIRISGFPRFTIEVFLVGGPILYVQSFCLARDKILEQLAAVVHNVSL